MSAGPIAKSSTRVLVEPVDEAGAEVRREVVAEVGGRALQRVDDRRQLADRRQRRVGREPVDVLRDRRGCSRTTRGSRSSSQQLQQIHRRGERVRLVGAVGRPVARRVVELRTRVRLPGLLQRVVLLADVLRAERDRPAAARSRRRANTSWLSLLRRPNTDSAAVDAGRRRLRARWPRLPWNDSEDIGMTWTSSETRLAVRSEMSNWRSDTCSPMSSSTCSSNPVPVRFACS